MGEWSEGERGVRQTDEEDGEDDDEAKLFALPSRDADREDASKTDTDRRDLGGLARLLLCGCVALDLQDLVGGRSGRGLTVTTHASQDDRRSDADSTRHHQTLPVDVGLDEEVPGHRAVQTELGGLGEDRHGATRVARREEKRQRTTCNNDAETEKSKSDVGINAFHLSNSLISTLDP